MLKELSIKGAEDIETEKYRNVSILKVTILRSSDTVLSPGHSSWSYEKATEGKGSQGYQGVQHCNFPPL